MSRIFLSFIDNLFLCIFAISSRGSRPRSNKSRSGFVTAIGKQIKYIWGKVNGHLLMSSSIKTFGFEKKINGPYLVVSYSRYRFENLPQSDCLSRKSENELEKIEWELSSGGKTNYWFRFYFSNLLENEWTGVLVKTSL